MAGGDFPAGAIISLNPFLLALELVIDILEWTGVIPDPIDLLIGAFQGRPKEEATVQTIQWLSQTRNPASRLFGIQLSRLLVDDGIVISTSDPNQQKILGHIEGNFTNSLIAQGVSVALARRILLLTFSTASQGGVAHPAPLMQPLAQGTQLQGPASISTVYNNGFQRGVLHGLQGTKLLRFAERFVYQHATYGELSNIVISDKIIPGDIPFPIVPQNGKCPDGYTLNSTWGLCVWTPPVSPPPPPPPPTPPPTGPPPPTVPPGPQGGGDGDELTDCCVQTAYYLGQIAQAITTLTGGQVPTGGGNPLDPTCCEEVVTAISSVQAAIAALPDALSNLGTGASSPPDFSGLISALNGISGAIANVSPSAPPDLTEINTALNALAACCAKLTPTDVAGIVEKLQQLWEQGDVDQSVIDSLSQRGLISAAMSQVVVGAKWSDFLAAMSEMVVGAIADTLFPGSGTAAEAAVDALAPKLVRESKEITGWTKSAIESLEFLFRRVVKIIVSYVSEAEGQLSNFLSAHHGDINAFASGFAHVIETLPVAGAEGVFDVAFRMLRAGGEITPDNVEDRFFQFYTVAWVIGQGVHLLKEVFGALKYPASAVWEENSKLLIDLLKFEPITHAMHGAFYPTAIGVPARYRFQREFRPFFPDNGRALELYARRLIDAPTRDTWISYNGLHASAVPSLTAAAHRPLSPFMLAAGFTDADIPTDELTAAFQYMGIRDEDIGLAMQAVKVRSLQSVRQGFINEAITGYGQGIISDDELKQTFRDAGWGQDAIDLAYKRALLLRRHTLGQAAEHNVVGLVAQGLMTPDDGRAQLEAAGVQPWKVDLEIELATTRATLAQARRDAAAERRLELQRQNKIAAAAIANYRSGVLDEAALSAALIADKLDPVIVASIVAVQHAIRSGTLRLVYGQLLPPADAIVLREKVSAIETQRKKQLIDDTVTRALLTALNIPGPEIQALLSAWAAAAAKKTTTGEALPQ